MSDVTQILSAMEQGDPRAAEELLPLVYDELRKLAAQKVALEAPGQTLDATSLVHEAYLRLVGSEQSRSWDSRGHFFSSAAEAMRRILVGNARRKGAQKRGGQYRKVDMDPAEIAQGIADEKLISMDEALTKFSSEAPQKAELVKLRYFAGLTIEQAAKAIGISTATANRHWAYARAWLQQEVSNQTH